EIKLPNCVVHGRIPLSEVADAYNHASLFCLPTRNEPFGIAFIEAMSAGLGIVATDIGAVPDLVRPGHNGERVRMNDVPQLTAALVDLLNKPELLEQYGRASSAIANQEYTWDAVGSRMKQIIEK